MNTDVWDEFAALRYAMTRMARELREALAEQDREIAELRRAMARMAAAAANEACTGLQRPEMES